MATELTALNRIRADIGLHPDRPALAKIADYNDDGTPRLRPCPSCEEGCCRCRGTGLILNDGSWPGEYEEEDDE